MPCKTLIRDLFISEDLYEGGQPQVSFQLQNPAGRTTSPPEGLRAKISTLDLTASVEQLPRDRQGFAARRLPAYREVISSVFDSIGEDASRFRGYRCALTYPLPLIEMVWWIPIPPKA